MRIGLRQVRALKKGETIWDQSLPGFGARRQNSEAVSYFLYYRTAEGRQRWYTIGKHGAPWTPDAARQEAKRIRGDVASKRDPAAEKRVARQAETVADLCDHYLTDVESGRLITRRRVPKKPSTIGTDRGRIERHIKPLLGRMKVAAVTREDVESFMHDVAEGKTAIRTKAACKKRGVAIVRGGTGTASRTVGLLGAIFTYAVRHRMRSDNPVRGIIRPAGSRRERRLSNDEYKMARQSIAKSRGDYLACCCCRHKLPCFHRLAFGRSVRFALGRDRRSHSAHRHSWRHKNRAKHAASVSCGLRCSKWAEPLR